MKWLRTATLVFLALLWGLVPQVPAQGAAGHDATRAGADRAGQWVVAVNASCAPTRANALICRRILGPFASLQNPAVFVSDAQGNVSFQDTYVVSEHVRGAHPLCSPAIYARPFDGVCRISEYGTGSIRLGATGLPDFWVQDETTTFYGTPTLSGLHNVLGPLAFPLDTLIPAVAGYYDTSTYLALLHLKMVPGVSIQMVVSQVQPNPTSTNTDPLTVTPSPTPSDPVCSVCTSPNVRVICCRQGHMFPQ